MKKWVLMTAGAALLAGGTLFAMQTGGNESPAEMARGAGAGEEAAASPAAMAARRAIAEDPLAPKHEPAGFDVTIISYADYQCPFCRKVHPELERLVREDGKVRIVYRDWPIFGAASEEAARAAVASQWQGKHAAFNDALMTTQGKLNSAKIRAGAAKAGLDWEQLQRDLESRSGDIDAVIGRTASQAAQMGLRGTPALLIGPYMVPGAIDHAGLVKSVALARKFNKEHPRAQPQES